jgi:hypothetical protein
MRPSTITLRSTDFPAAVTPTIVCRSPLSSEMEKDPPFWPLLDARVNGPLPGRSDQTGDSMHTVQVLALLLAMSGALNVAFAAGLTARHAGAAPAQAILTAAGAAATVLSIFFVAVSAYR